MNQVFFDKSVYHTRRNQLAKSIQKGLIILPSNEEAGMNYADNTYPYRQDSSFLYFCGIDRPGLIILIDAHTGETILAGEESTLDDIVWTGPVETLNQLVDRAGIDRIISTTQAIEWIQKLLQQHVPLHYLPIYRGDQAFRLSKLIGISAEAVYKTSSTLLIQAIVALREIKSDLEISELTKAINISGQMHVAMMKLAKAGMTEAEVMAAVRSISLQQQVDVSYPIILSVNGQTLHNHSHHNTLQKGQLLLGDFGSESAMHYAGDITRTIPVSESFNELQANIYELVLKTLKLATSSIRAGIKYLDVHLIAAQYIASGLKDLNFLKGDVDELIAQGAHALFFPHGLGHALGLDVHDMENLGESYVGYEDGLERSKQFGLKSLRLAKSLKTGMVLTVEPGIYFIPELIALWKSQNKFPDFINYNLIEKALPFGGIRIEDNILVQAEHAVVIGNPIPKELSDVESLREQAYSA